MTELMGVKPEEIRAINREHGGTTQLNSTVESVFAAALYYKHFWERLAIVSRGIVSNHLFNDGNKRTGFDTVRLFQKRNSVVTGVMDPSLREVMRDLAIPRIREVEEIARRLRGF